MELANEIYIFTSPNRDGIKFYDRSPEGAVAKFAGSLPEGKYLTDRASVSIVKWDNDVNGYNETKKLKYMDGECSATTWIVSNEEMLRILDSIVNAEEPERITIGVNRVDANIYAESKNAGRSL